MKELAKQYDPSQVEDRIYQFWLDGGYFHTKADPDKKPYTIVMPPPNITGQLHMGHALDETLQDILREIEADVIRAMPQPRQKPRTLEDARAYLKQVCTYIYDNIGIMQILLTNRTTEQ